MHAHHDDHHSGHDHGPHGHSHGAVDPSIVASEKGLRAVKWSFLGLMATALFQVVVVWLTGSVALLSDTVHNFGDASTAIPLAVAFLLARRAKTKRFTYGLGKVEDLAGVIVVALILLSGGYAIYQSVMRFLYPQPVTNLFELSLASIVGFLGNEIVGRYRISVAREIQSKALEADGYHARTDAWTSAGVLVGAFLVWLGLQWADPLVGFLIGLTILRIVWQTGKMIFTRLLDGIEPKLIDKITEITKAVPGVQEVYSVCGRWSGHFLHLEFNIAVAADKTADANKIVNEVRHQLGHKYNYIEKCTIDTSMPDAHHHEEGHHHDHHHDH